MLTTAIAAPALSIASEPVPVDGFDFPSIADSSGPEDFLWKVEIGPEQELRQVDDQHAAVVYTDPGDHVAFIIEAAPAHDAHGATVPTSIAVSGADEIVLTVHHRAGNPVAGGAPFVYPINYGAGWEGGFVTYYIQMPPGESAVAPVEQCIVPRLGGRSLAAVRQRLSRAKCQLGKIGGERSRGARVVKQSQPAGTVLAAGARVAVRLG